MDLDISLLDTSSSAVALRHEPPPLKRLRLSQVNTTDDQAVPEWDCSAPYEQWLDYSAYESRYKSPSLHSSNQDNLAESNGQTIQDDDGDDDQVVELRKSTATMPSFFHPGMYN